MSVPPGETIQIHIFLIITKLNFNATEKHHSVTKLIIHQQLGSNLVKNYSFHLLLFFLFVDDGSV